MYYFLNFVFQLQVICDKNYRFEQLLNKCGDRHFPLLAELGTHARIATHVSQRSNLVCRHVPCAPRNYRRMCFAFSFSQVKSWSMVSGIPLANRREGEEARSFAIAKVPRLNASEVRRWIERACLRGVPDDILIHILILSLTDMELKL